MFLGIDISKRNFDAALLDPSRPGKPRHRAFRGQRRARQPPDGFQEPLIGPAAVREELGEVVGHGLTF